MDAKQLVLTGLKQADFFANSYLADLTPEELFTRVVPGANHIAWQLGHLINAENSLLKRAFPGQEAELPEGFTEKHSKATADIDDPAAFYTKDEYLAFAKTVRERTLAVLDSLSPEDLDQPAGPKFPPFIQKIGDLFTLTPNHWCLHAGQWVVLRRKVGKTGLF